MPDPKNRRRQYLVNRKIQLQFTLLLIVQIAIPTIILGSFIYIINKMYLSCIQKLIGTSVISDPYVQSILNISVLGIGIFLIVSTMLLVFLGIRFTHHIAGPLFKLEKSMEKLLKGESIKPLHFRKSDIIDNIADDFNAIAEKMNQLKK